MSIVEELESEVRSYCRTWPTEFKEAHGAILTDTSGREFIDFFSGAGTLNYGHNNDLLKQPLIDYLTSNGVTHGLDMTTSAKTEFLEVFKSRILTPRGLPHKVQFPGPTGTNAVEAALKLVRKVSGRPNVVAFTNAFHGMSLGSLALTGNADKRAGAGVPLDHVLRVPYDGFDPDVDGLALLDRMLSDGGSGLDRPGAVVVETVQGEGGVNVARVEWLQELSDLCRRHELLLVVDDVQMGCGRTGAFFSFEEAGIVPDVICLSKSISGYGLPMALVLLRPELDVWRPGEHNGTFRGNNLAFVTGAAALRAYWSDSTLEKSTGDLADQVRERLTRLAGSVGADVSVRGRGLVQGLRFAHAPTAAAVGRRAFELGLLVETSGPRDEVLKLLPPLTVDGARLDAGLTVLERAVRELA
ncbi:MULTISPECIES: diaminobutyrate--2-oxoglutarate transaminase [unclassified Streptomyces]|uniref:diaminobutyrate--2-oxoglutarate transaminase n=1 Tax=unclassified Streptomyces TaxID=2593676 RepID=UPI0035E2943F